VAKKLTVSRICNPTGLFADFKSAIKPAKDYKSSLTEFKKNEWLMHE